MRMTCGSHTNLIPELQGLTKSMIPIPIPIPVASDSDSDSDCSVFQKPLIPILIPIPASHDSDSNSDSNKPGLDSDSDSGI